ncbi:MAG: helix-hairpin-helix domain-containing protein [Lachnospiraceae bacterium]|nr:helix-hairpin-helix domain-containing protein [Lachnospiraceae bacterium]
MSTKAEIQRKKALKKRINLIAKVIGVIILVILGLIYCTGRIESRDSSKVYDIKESQDVPTANMPDERKNLVSIEKSKEIPNYNDNTDEDKTDSDAKDTVNDEESDPGDKCSEKTSELITKAPGISADGRVNINTASISELCTLNGIGEKRAKDIIEYRETYGEFRTIEDIMKVKGIKQGVFSKIKDNICCEGP